MRKYFILILFILYHITTTAQTQRAAQVFVINYKQDIYKAARQNWSSADDIDGRIYFGNNDGILSFDGIRWTTIILPEKKVVRSVLAHENKLYFGSFEEFGYLVDWFGEQKKIFRLSDSIPQDLIHNNEIWRIIEHKNKIYFQSFGAIYVFDGKTVKTIRSHSSYVLLLKADNRLFIHLIDYGLHEIINDKIYPLDATKPLGNDEIKIVLPFAKDTLLIGAAKAGLFLLINNQKLEKWNTSVNQVLQKAQINAGLNIKNLFVTGTIVNGIYIFNKKGEIIQHLNTSNLLNNNTVLSLNKDRFQNFWATLDDGLAYIRTNDPLEFYLSPMLNKRAVYDAVSFQNKLWVGTNQGVYVYESGSAGAFENPQLIEGTQGQVWDLELIDEQLFCGHTDGTFKLSENTLEKISNVHGGFQLQQLNPTTLIQSTYNEFVIYKKNKDWEFSNTIKGFSEPIPSFSIDFKNNLWAAHLHKGLYKIELNQNLDSVKSLRYFDHRHGLKNSRNLFVGELEGRVIFLNGSEIYTYDDIKDTIIPYLDLNKKLGIFSAANRMFKAGNSGYWFISNNKMALFKYENKHLSNIFEYDLGRQGVFLAANYPNISTIDSAVFLIGLDNGFAIFKNPVTIIKQKPAVYLRNISISDNLHRKLLVDMSIKDAIFPYKYNNVLFEFSPNRPIVAPQFRYKLKSYDNNWSSWSENSEVSFERLPSGKYIFELQLMDIQGNISESTFYEFRIKPPFFLSWWAFLLYIPLIYLTYRSLRNYFYYRIKKQAFLLHQKQIDEQQKKYMLEEQTRIKQNNRMLLDEVNSQNAELANYTLLLSRMNKLITEFKEEVNKQKKELGNRLPKIYSDRLLKLIDSMENKEDVWSTFEIHFNRINNQFVHRLKDLYPELTSSDLKLCVLLRLNLTTKEIAPLLNITVRGVEIRRYRLRKRLKLNSDENLNDFLMQF